MKYLVSIEELKESELIYCNLLETVDVGFYQVTLDGQMLNHNRAHNIILGYNPSESLKSEDVRQFWQNPEDREHYIQYLLEHNFTKNYTCHALKKNGEKIIVELNSHLIQDDEGNPIRIDGTFIDITEKFNLEKKLKESEKKYREAFDRANFYKDLFTHDINNILQIINSSAELISYHLGDSEKSKTLTDLAKIINQQIDRGAKLVSNVRTLSELEEQEVILHPINLCGLLRNSINFIKNAFGEKDLKIQIESSSQEIIVQANELLQGVFENMLINSIKYNENSNVDIDIKISQIQLNSKNFIKIEFTDNGIGVPDDRKEIIFKRGHRKLKGSKGMGLGLALVKKILKSLHGKIWVEDKEKGDYTKGSNFIILLPE